MDKNTNCLYYISSKEVYLIIEKTDQKYILLDYRQNVSTLDITQAKKFVKENRGYFITLNINIKESFLDLNLSDWAKHYIAKKAKEQLIEKKNYDFLNRSEIFKALLTDEELPF